MANKTMKQMDIQVKGDGKICFEDFHDAMLGNSEV
jgi:hypothetical protein